jgi:hypothetical protein
MQLAEPNQLKIEYACTHTKVISMCNCLISLYNCVIDAINLCILVEAKQTMCEKSV